MDLSGCGVSVPLTPPRGIAVSPFLSACFRIVSHTAEISLHREAVPWKFPEERLSKPDC
jgi:hypothetical protein